MGLSIALGAGVGLALVGPSDRTPRGIEAQASSSAAGQPAALATDGRLRGTVPFAWRPGASGSARLTLRFPMPVPLVAVRVIGAARVIAPRPTSSDGEVTGFAGSDASELVVETDGADIAEIEPILNGAPVLVAADPDWAIELLRAYGVPTVAAVAPGPGLAIALAHSRAILVADAALPEAAVGALRSAAENGATIVELGPRAGLCSSAAGAAIPAARERRLTGGIRWPTPLTPSPEGSATVRLASADGIPVLVERALGSGRCLTWLGDVLATMAQLRFGDEPAARDFGDRFSGLLRADHDVPSADLLFGYVLAAMPGALVSPLPDGAASVLVLTADQDYAPDALVAAQVAGLPPGAITVLLTDALVGSAPDVRFPQSPAGLSAPETIRALLDAGQDVGIHPFLGDGDPTDTVREHAAALADVTRVRPRIIRMHHLAWAPELPHILAAVGLAMDLDFVSLARLPEGDLGYMAGGGVPLRFLDTDGAVLPVLQQPTMLDDHVLLPARFGYRSLDVPALIARSRQILDIATRAAVPVVVNHHPDWFVRTDGAWQQALVDEAAARGIPLWSAGRWLDFTEARRQVVAAATEGGERVFVPVAGVTLLVDAGITVTADGRRLVARGERQVGWRRYQVFVPPPGTVVLGRPR